MSIKCSCPDCGSDNTQRVSLAYQAGVSTGLSLSVGGIKGGGHKALGGGVKIGGTSSDLWKSLRPPKKKSLVRPIVNGVFLFSFAAVYIASEMINPPEPVGISGWVFLLVLIAFGIWCIRLVIMRIKSNTEVFPTLLKSWNTEFICLRCSRRFRVD